jgi:hypothetical protein
MTPYQPRHARAAGFARTTGSVPARDVGQEHP